MQLQTKNRNENWINQVATAALYYIMDLYLPTSLNIPNMEEDSEVDQENWEYEWEENELEDQFSYVQINSRLCSMIYIYFGAFM